jgi:hypothetical protein
MRLSSNSLRAIVAAGVSLWIGVLACVMGCALPAVASAESSALVQTQSEAAQRDDAPMAGMENCPHHSGSKAPGKPADGRSPGGSMPGRMSCCPPEVTVAPKSHFSFPAIVVVVGLVMARPLQLSTSGFPSLVAFVPPVISSGRDTLLKTRLLRI